MKLRWKENLIFSKFATNYGKACNSHTNYWNFTAAIHLPASSIDSLEQRAPALSKEVDGTPVGSTGLGGAFVAGALGTTKSTVFWVLKKETKRKKKSWKFL